MSGLIRKMMLLCEDAFAIDVAGMTRQEAEYLWNLGLRGGTLGSSRPDQYRFSKDIIPGRWRALKDFIELGPPDMTMIEFVDAWLGDSQ